MPDIKPFTLVRTTFDKLTLEKYYKKELKVDRNYLFLSEITNMLGHCMLFDLERERILGPFHTNEFRVCTEEEV